RQELELNPHSPKTNLPHYKNDKKHNITQNCGHKRTTARRNPGIGFHQSWHRRTANNASNNAADRYAVWNDKMFKIDKCSNDQKRNKNPVRNRHLPRKGLPDDQEQQRSDQFHREIAKGDFRAAIRAATAEQNPANQRQILMPGNLLFARRAKRATRFVNRKIDRPAINADVQKG